MRLSTGLLCRLPLRASAVQAHPLIAAYVPAFRAVGGPASHPRYHSALRTKAEAANARKGAEAEADSATLDAEARKSASELSLGKLGMSLPNATVVAAVVVVALTLVLSQLGDSSHTAGQADAVRRFERRRIDAVKERILASRPASLAQPGPAFDDLFSRPEALRALECMSTKAGIYMVVGPKGEGKSALASQFVASHPYVLYVDLQAGSMDRAVRAVAAALGYDMLDSTGEASARQRGCKLPDLQAPQSTDMYETLLKVFEAACTELRSEGALVQGSSPVLVLDHANRPLRRSSTAPAAPPASPALDAPTPTAAPVAASADVNLMYSTVEIGHRFANRRIASLVMVSSGLLQELDAWKRAGGRDSVRFIRVAPFSDADAAGLLSRRIFASRGESGARPPTPEDTAAIQREYSSTISTITLALGTRARWLVQSLQHLANAPLTDAELAERGVPIPAHYHPYLPAELRDNSLRVDPGVWVALQSLIESRKGEADCLLSVGTDFSLPPSALSESWANAFAERIVAVDSALRALLIAPIPHAGLQKRFFASSEHVLRRLAEQHVVFYNQDTKDVEMESPLVHRVVSALLSSRDHELSVQLVQQLLQWQAAAMREAKLEQRMAAESRSLQTARLTELEGRLDAASEKVQKLLEDVEATRSALRELRR